MVWIVKVNTLFDFTYVSSYQEKQNLSEQK